MKIIILGPAHPYRGGISDTNEALCSNLQAQGHTVSIWTFKLQYPAFLFPGKSQFSTKSAPKNLHIRREINSLYPWNWIRVAKKITNESPDLVIVRYWTPFLAIALGFITKKIRGSVKKIAITDNIVPHERVAFQQQLTRFFCNQFDGFITLSNAVKKELSLLTKKPIVVLSHPINNQLPFPVDPIKAQQILGLDSDKKYLLFFGLVRKYKGLDILLKALPSVLKKFPKTHLLVVGEHYESYQKYIDLTNSLGIESCVTFKNQFVTQDEMSHWFSASDLVVQPYKSASQSGITPLAMWYKKPTVVTKVGGLFESVVDKKTGWVVTPSAKGIANGIEHFLSTKNQESIQKSIQSEQKKLSWSYFCKKCIEFNNTIE